MGVFKFRVPDYWQLEPRHARTIHLIGLDGVPRPCSVKQNGQVLSISRNLNESAKTYIAYPFEKFGELTICTGTLLESDKTYDLGVELARGTLNRLRNQTSIWQEGGLEIPTIVHELTANAIAELGAAIIGGDTEENGFRSRQSLEFAIQAIYELCEQFGDNISEFRVTQTGIPSFWQAVTVNNPVPTAQQLEPFDLIQPQDVSLAHSEDNQQRTIIGPILDSSPRSKFSFEPESYEQGRDELLGKLDQLLAEMPDSASLIHAACNLNGIGQRNLSYRQQLQLTSEILGRIENSDSDVPAMVSFDYPWAERLAWSVGGIHPMQIAEDLTRNGARISFIGLDINLDYWPGGSIARDPLQWIDLIDAWCQFGMPLVLCLRIPKLCGDELQNADTETKQPAEPRVSRASRASKCNQIADNMTDIQRWRLAKVILKIAVARPGVHGVIWRQWSDAEDERYPFGGLVDAKGNSKQVLAWLSEFKKETLKR